MDEALQRQIQARFEELPADVQRAIRSSNMDAKIQDVGRKHSLHLDQIGDLSDETHLVMLGFSDPNEFPENLAKELRLPPEKAEAVAKDISESLFMPIRASMQQFAEEQALHAAILEEGKAEASAPARAPIASPVVPPTQKQSVATAPLSPKLPPSATSPAAALAKPPMAAPAPKPAAPIPPPPVLKPAELHPADMMLSQKTVTVAPPAPKAPPAPGASAAPAAPKAPQGAPATPTPAAQGSAPAKPEPPAPLGRSTSMGEAKPYAADPYREPIQ